MLLELPVIIGFRETISDFEAHPSFFLCLYILIPFSLICSLICLIIIFRKIKSLEKKTVRMREINRYIQRGASVYLHQQSKMLLLVVAILFVPVGLTGIQFLENGLLGFFIVGIIFVLGAVSSLTAGYIGMLAATKANILVIEASMDDPNEGFKLAYYGGMITGILNISMFVLGIWLLLILTNNNIYLMISYDFGASVAALLAVFGLFMSIGGASFDNAKKGIEAGLFGGKGSFAHKAAIIGDTVGDPLKDTAGPSMNILITTVNTMAITFLPIFMMTGFLYGLFPF